jgi:serine kinase of HPr protein (carbohydrate metabolism regulator)
MRAEHEGLIVSAPLLVHGTAVALDGEALLLRGPPGAGKSDLALRLIDGGAQLVADDQTELSRRGDRIWARAPAIIAGLIEVRGIGLLRCQALEEAPLALLVDLVASAAVERLPEAAVETVLGLAVRRLAIAPFEASAVAKLRFLRRTFTAARPRDIFGA